MEQDAGNGGTKASVLMTVLKVVVAVVFIAGMTFVLVVGYAHFDDGSDTPQFESVEGYEFRQVVVNDWENPGPDHDKYNRSEIERLVVEYTNEERRAEGLPELDHNKSFTSIARSHSADMANNGYVGHVDSQGREFSDRIDFEDDIDSAVCIPVDEVQTIEDLNELGNITTGENAGVTFYEAPLRDERTGEKVTPENEDQIAKALVNGWMASPAHRKNILDDDWKVLSVGVYVSEGKTVFATQIFCGVEGSL